MFSNSELVELEHNFHTALDIAAKEGSLDPLIHYLSTLFDCDRIYIFLKNRSGNYDMAYEWCAPGVPHRQHTIQNLHWEVCTPYYNRFQNDQLIEFDDVEQILFSDPELYHILKPQNVKSLLAGQLKFYNQDLGFFGLDNIHPSHLPHAAGYFRTLRYFIGAVLMQQKYDSHQLNLAHTGNELGIGNWHNLYDAMDRMNRNTSIGIIYINLLTMTDINLRRGRQFGDNLLVEVGKQIISTFSIHNVFRIHGDDYVIVCDNTSQQWFRQRSDVLKKKLMTTGIAMEYGYYWVDCWNQSSYHMLKQAKSRMVDLMQQLENPNAPIESSLSLISLYRGEEFTTRADTWLRMLPPEQRRIAVFAIDYDNFMLYNSIFGRPAGDILLKNISRALLSEAHEFHGITGYMGGDNFILILPLHDMTREEVAAKVLLEIQKNTRHTGFSPSCGICLCENYTNESAALLYDHALTALSQIKNSFTEHVAFFNPDVFNQIRQTQLMMMDIDAALKHKEFTFYLQPKVDMRTGRPISAEALVRWRKDDRIIPPGVFIPQMEENGYIFALDCYIWEAVCRYQRHLLNHGITPCPISVNISQVDFYFDDLADHIHSLVKSYDLDPKYLDIEITESAYAKEQTLISDFIDTMHGYGFKILIDDFGNGYSSLGTLQHFNADTLKIDKQFIDPLKLPDANAGILSSIISMAKFLNFQVIAEGVETVEQKQILLDMNCNYGQGYLFYRPLPQEEFTELLRTYSS